MKSEEAGVDCPRAILLFLAALEILVALMGYVPRFATAFQMLAALAGVVTIAQVAARLTARWKAATEANKSRRFGKTQQLLLCLFVAVAIAFCLPIWHRHGDFAGQMHGHPIWATEHWH